MTPKEIGKCVSAYFKRAGITQKEVASRLGFSSRQVVSNQLNGKKFGVVTAEKYAKAYGFSILFLLTGRGSLFGDEQEEISRLKKERDNLKKANLAQLEAIHALMNN